LYSLSRRHWLRHLRRYVIDITGLLVTNSHSFDSAASAALAVIQEVELVSRGYRLSHPLPPVTRLEEQHSHTKRCLKLRRLLATSLVDLLERYLEAKQKLTPLSNHADLDKYHDIYDFSTHELHDAESALAAEDEDKTSLKSLRLLFARLYSARKGLLCCLLAIPAKGREQDIPVWGLATDELQALTATTTSSLVTLSDFLNDQNGPSPLPSTTASHHHHHHHHHHQLPSVDAAKQRNRAQLRKLNALSQGVRAIHAKMNLIREDAESCLDGTNDDPDFNTTLMAMYDSIGTDLRGLIQEWEVGKTALQVAFAPSLASSPTTSESFRRSVSLSSSRPPSGKWLPGSPASTLSGTTAIDTSNNGFLISANNHPGDPDNALRILTGAGAEEDFKSPDTYLADEEVFEAMATPITVSRKRASLSREERIARMKEERAKHSAARDRQDTNTHMLRELET
ncbi:hypothetical protein KEM56_004636, partial [Ascosphaera pollenicola]